MQGRTSILDEDDVAKRGSRSRERAATQSVAVRAREPCRGGWGTGFGCGPAVVRVPAGAGGGPSGTIAPPETARGRRTAARPHRLALQRNFRARPRRRSRSGRSGGSATAPPRSPRSPRPPRSSSSSSSTKIRRTSCRLETQGGHRHGPDRECRGDLQHRSRSEALAPLDLHPAGQIWLPVHPPGGRSSRSGEERASRPSERPTACSSARARPAATARAEAGSGYAESPSSSPAAAAPSPTPTLPARFAPASARRPSSTSSTVSKTKVEKVV